MLYGFQSMRFILLLLLIPKCFLFNAVVKGIFKKLIHSFIHFWLHWVFVAACRLSLVAASGGYSSLRCTGFSLRWLLLLQSMGSKRVGSVVVAHSVSCSAACGIFPDEGSNPCLLHWQVDF